jgi:hypothetical protein
MVSLLITISVITIGYFVYQKMQTDRKMILDEVIYVDTGEGDFSASGELLIYHQESSTKNPLSEARLISLQIGDYMYNPVVVGGREVEKVDIVTKVIYEGEEKKLVFSVVDAVYTRAVSEDGEVFFKSTPVGDLEFGNYKYLDIGISYVSDTEEDIQGKVKEYCSEGSKPCLVHVNAGFGSVSIENFDEYFKELMKQEIPVFDHREVIVKTLYFVEEEDKL